LLFTKPSVNHANTQAHNQINKIAVVLFKLRPANHTIINAVIHMINTVQKSGINKNIKYSNALNTMNVHKNCGESIFSFFLVNQLAKNIT
jgi:hypothetical protein